MKESKSKVPLYIGGMVILIGVLVLLAKESLFIVVASIVLVSAIVFIFINRNKISAKLPGIGNIKEKKWKKEDILKWIEIFLILAGIVFFLGGYMSLSFLTGIIAFLVLLTINDWRWLIIVFIAVFSAALVFLILFGLISIPVDMAHNFGRGY